MHSSAICLLPTCRNKPLRRYAATSMNRAVNLGRAAAATSTPVPAKCSGVAAKPACVDPQYQANQPEPTIPKNCESEMNTPQPTEVSEFNIQQRDAERDGNKFGTGPMQDRIELYRVATENPDTPVRRIFHESRPKPHGSMPQELDEYIRRVQFADLAYGRAERGARLQRGIARGPHPSASKLGPFQRKTLSMKAEEAYQRALEYLEELICFCPGLVWYWLDRNVNFAHPIDAPSPDPDGVPRVVTVRSKYRRNIQ